MSETTSSSSLSSHRSHDQVGKRCNFMPASCKVRLSLSPGLLPCDALQVDTAGDCYIGEGGQARPGAPALRKGGKGIEGQAVMPCLGVLDCLLFPSVSSAS